MIRRNGLGMFEYLLSVAYMSDTMLNVLQLYKIEIIVISYSNDCEFLTKYSSIPLCYLSYSLLFSRFCP